MQPEKKKSVVDTMFWKELQILAGEVGGRQNVIIAAHLEIM